MITYTTLEKALKAREQEKSEKLELDEAKTDEMLKTISKLKPADKVKDNLSRRRGLHKHRWSCIKRESDG